MNEWFKKKYVLTEQTIKDFQLSWKDDTMFFPVIDEYNHIGFTKYRHKLEPIMNPKGGRTALYGANLASQSNSSNIVIVEGESDCLALHTVGITAITSTSGAMSIAKLFFNGNFPEYLTDKQLYVLLDNDITGVKATKKIWQSLEGSEYKDNFHFCFWPDGTPDKYDTKDHIQQGKNIKQILNRHHTWEELKGKTIHDVEFTLDTPVEVKHSFTPKSYNQDMVNQLENAKAVPFTDLAEFDRSNNTQCPWHNDKNASLHLYPKSNTTFCFVCDKGHDTIDYIQKTQSKTFKEALDYLAPPPKIQVTTKDIL